MMLWLPPVILAGSFVAMMTCGLTFNKNDIRCNRMSLFSEWSYTQNKSLFFNPSSYEQHIEEVQNTVDDTYTAFVAVTWVFVSALLGVGYMLTAIHHTS